MAKQTKNKNEIYWGKHTIVTPTGSALFASLAEPDTYKGGDPTWKVTIVFDENTEFNEFKTRIINFAAEYSKHCGKLVDPNCVFRVDKQTGKPCMTLKSKVKLSEAGTPIPFPIVDADKKETTEPWNGDLIRASFKLGGWMSAFGVGIKAYLGAVQVVERRRGKGGNTYDPTSAFEDTDTATNEIPF